MPISHQFPLMFSCAYACVCACGYLTSENQALPSSLSIKQSFPATHIKFLKGQIIGKSIKTRIYTFISNEVLFPRPKIYFLRPIVDLKVRSQGEPVISLSFLKFIYFAHFSTTRTPKRFIRLHKVGVLLMS